MKINIERELAEIRREVAKKKSGAAAVESLNVKDHIAPCYYPLHDDIEAAGHLFYNLPGGRGSCKSSFVSLEIVNSIMQDPTGGSSAIVFRKIAGTMRESVYAQISWAISELGVYHLWRGSVSPMQFTYLPTGAQIIFRGLDDASKLKSIKPRKGIFRYVWFEEFAELPGANFQRNVLQSVVRGGNDFVVFRSFNPPMSANNWANTMIQEPDERAITLLTNYTMIPAEWLGSSFLYEAEKLKEINPRSYEHEYMGIPTGTGGEVFPNLEIREITEDEISNLNYIYHGLDFGYAVDPACFIRAAYEQKTDTIFLLDEIFKKQWSNKQMADEIKRRGYAYTGKVSYTYFGGESPLQEKTIITCDAAEPKSIADMQHEGLKAVACHKEPGCVEYRIKWLQHRRIVIDPKRTPEAYREFVGYSYGTDKDGNFVSTLPDKDNHSIDSLAYALNKLIYYRKISA